MARFFSAFFVVFALFSAAPSISVSQNVVAGADQTDLYLPLLKGKRVAAVVNQTSVVRSPDGTLTPLVDSLVHREVDIRFVMTPEHGLKGRVSAGAPVPDGYYDTDRKIAVRSLYGKTKKPAAEWLQEIDAVVFDIQDVGCRFYTYLSTLTLVMEACGEQHKELIVLDRPNPHDTIDGPMLEAECKSFVGYVPVPLLHGCTLGELARMIAGEGWAGPEAPRLTVIPCSGWTHGQPYDLPIAPSPNLRSAQAIRLYPSLCLLEATDVSVGRGTPWPFEVIGHPHLKGPFDFTPRPCEAATDPLQNGHLCHGFDLRQRVVALGFHLEWLQLCADALGPGWIRQPRFFDRLAGTPRLRTMMAEGTPEDAIRQSWQPALKQYRSLRDKYVLYRSGDEKAKLDSGMPDSVVE